MTRSLWRAATALAVLSAGSLAPAGAAAQQFRLRLDGRAQVASFRGVQADSVPASAVVPGPNGTGTFTPDGYAATCPAGGYCLFYRPGPALRAAPVVAAADLTMWGLGVTGLRVRVNSRLMGDLGDSSVAWPTTDPALQLIEGYAEYAADRWTLRGGRQLLADRLGFSGFDGGRLLVRDGSRTLEGEVYVGWGLGRAVAVPVSSPTLNPIDEFQPRARQIVAGGAAGVHARGLDARLEYRREVDPESDQFVAERAALSVAARPRPRWSLEAGADYDLAQGWLGSAEAVARYTTPRVTLAAGGRRYRPFFELWTIWGAFSPVPYHAVYGTGQVNVGARLQLRARGEYYAFANTETSTPLADVEENGWRYDLGATFRPDERWTIDASHQAEFGPGAASTGVQGLVTYRPTRALSATAQVAILARPLELRLDDARVRVFGLDAEWAPGDRFRVGAGAAHYWEARRRPDAASFDWNQTRLNLRVTLLFGSSADRMALPPARPRLRPRIGGPT